MCVCVYVRACVYVCMYVLYAYVRVIILSCYSRVRFHHCWGWRGGGSWVIATQPIELPPNPQRTRPPLGWPACQATMVVMMGGYVVVRVCEGAALGYA